MSGALFIAWGFERSWAGLLLVLPLAVVLLARRRDRPRPLFTGAFELWLSVAARAPEASRAPRRRTPPAAWLFAAGLACAVAALAGPRPDVGVVAWRVVVDRSPSMYLPSDGGTRLERALAVLAAHGSADAACLWIDAGADPPVLIGARELPAAWRAPPITTRGELDRVAHDTPGTIVLTDRAAGARLERASLSAGGGAAVPGLVAVDASGAWSWDGARLSKESAAGRAARVRLAGAHAPEIARFVEVWCAARGHLLVDAGGDRVELEVAAPAAGAAARALGSFGRDGWVAQGSGVLATAGRDELGGLSTWLADAGGEALVQSGPGRVRVAWTGERGLELDRAGDAAFAVSFGALLDACIEPPPGVVRLDERADAGASAWIAGAPPAGPRDAVEAGARWQAGLALLALVLVLVALAWPAFARGA